MQPFNLAMTKHRQSRHRRQHGRNTDIFIPGAKLFNRRFFIRVTHKIDKALQDLRIEGEDVFQGLPIFAILFLLQHIHKGAIVDPVHSQGTDEIALHQPESFSQQQGIRSLNSNPVNQFTPEFNRKMVIELFLTHGVITA